MKSKPRVRESDALRERTRIDTDSVILHDDGKSIPTTRALIASSPPSGLFASP